MGVTNSKITQRIMGDMSIAKSFKGILRIAHILELVEGQDDDITKEIENPTYYGIPKQLVNISSGVVESPQIGYPNPIIGLDGNMIRYSQSNPTIQKNPLLENRLPLTDSMGNYLNWNVGLDGVTIGSNSNINNFTHTSLSLNTPQPFPILKTENSVIVGMEKSKKKDGGDGYRKEKINQGSFVEISGSSDAMMIHDITQAGKSPKKYVVYKSTKPNIQHFDTLMFSQDDWLKDKSGNEYYVADMVNLKDYVSKILKYYVTGNVVEVPTGTVINQYCSLNKWYAKGDQGIGNKVNLNESERSFPGHRPSLMYKRNIQVSGDTENNSQKADGFVTSTIQGACRKINRLINNNRNKTTSDEATMVNIDNAYLNEIIPLYKRDYVLCDGSVYTIYATPNNHVNFESFKRDSYERFFNLFFCIGYDYTNLQYVHSKICNPTMVNKDGSIVDAKYFFEDVTDFSGIDLSKYIKTIKLNSNSNIDRHCLFTQDLITLLAFQVLYSEYQKNVRGWDNLVKQGDYTPMEQWLMGQSIPDQYVFNSFINHEEGLKVTYRDGDDKKVKINIGKQVNNFGAEILYAEPVDDNGIITFSYTKTPIIKLPSIQLLLKLFGDKKNDEKEVPLSVLRNCLMEYFYYPFQVPNLTENVPSFIGSNGINWSDSQYNKIRVQESWTSDYSQSTYPHRHYVFRVLRKQLNPADRSISKNTSKMKELFGGTSITANSYVSPYGYHGGGRRDEDKVYNFGQGEHHNYIFNALVGNKNKPERGHGLVYETNAIDEDDSQEFNLSFPTIQRYCIKTESRMPSDNLGKLYKSAAQKAMNKIQSAFKKQYKTEYKCELMELEVPINRFNNSTKYKSIPAWTTGNYRQDSVYARNINENTDEKDENDVIKKIDLKRVEKNGVITEKNDLSSGIINKHFHPVYPLHFKFNVVIDGKTYEIDTSDVQISDKEDEQIKKFKNFLNDNEDYKNYTNQITSYVYYPITRGYDIVKKENSEGQEGFQYACSHSEDPRFANHQPNRGRTSLMKNNNQDEQLKNNYKSNSTSFSKNFRAMGRAQWFTPKNIKMLPLIKL